MNRFFKKNIMNIILTFCTKGFAMILTVLLDAAIAQHLGIINYGEWSFFFAFLTIIFNVSWAGVNTASRVYMTITSDSNLRNNYVNSAILLRFIISFFFSITTLLVATIINNLNISILQYPNIAKWIYFVPFLLFFNCWTDFIKNIEQGLENYQYLLLLTVIEYSGYFLFSLLFLSYTNNPIGILKGYLLTGSIIFLFSLRILKQHNFILSKKYVIRKQVKELFWQSIPLAIACIGQLLLTEIDIIMLGSLSIEEEVSIYSIAKNLCSKASHVNLSFIIATVSPFAIINHINIKEKKKKFIQLQVMNLIITIFVVTLLVLFSNVYVRVLYGENYLLAAKVIKLLSMYYALNALTGYCSFFLEYQKLSIIRSIGYVITIIADVLLNYLWIPRYGALGATYATIISSIPYCLILIFMTIHIFRSISKKI